MHTSFLESRNLQGSESLVSARLHSPGHKALWKEEPYRGRKEESSPQREDWDLRDLGKLTAIKARSASRYCFSWTFRIRSCRISLTPAEKTPVKTNSPIQVWLWAGAMADPSPCPDSISLAPYPEEVAFLDGCALHNALPRTRSCLSSSRH